MDHPFLIGKNFYYYIGMWVVVTGAHIAVLFSLFDTPLNLAFLDGIIYNSLFAVLGFSYWFAIRFGPYQGGNILVAFVSHIVGGLLTIGLCVWLANLIMINYSNIGQYFVTSTTPWKIFSGFFYYSVTVLFYYLVKSYRDIQYRSEVESKLATEVKESELSMLKAQINPHFIFNSLNSISALTITRPDDAREMIVKLSSFLRYSLGNDDHTTSSLEDELNNTLLYLEIEKVRFGDKLNLKQEINPEALNWAMPNMMLQPLIENAIKFGVYESIEAVSIELKAVVNNERLEVKITNGFDPEAVQSRGKGIGLKNVSHRLQLIYNRDDLLKVQKLEGQFIVTLILPKSIQSD